MKDVSKSYHGAPAVRNVDSRCGKVKSMHCAARTAPENRRSSRCYAESSGPTSGQITLDGEEFHVDSPAEARELGIVMVFQESSLVPSMTVAQNLYLGDEKTFNRLRPLYILAQVFLSSLNFDIDPSAQVAQLGAAKKQELEIAPRGSSERSRYHFR